jgi:multimeric flavodoxin WrbA
LPTKRVLIIYYSFTQQTKLQLKQLIAGLESSGIEIALERLEPASPYEFPFRTNLRLALAMIETFFRRRMEILPVSAQCIGNWDRIILAGPTWSYHPSGPMLDFLDRYGREICAGKRVIPLISCRSYWRWHFRTLKTYLQRCGALVEEPIVFTHPIREPWRLIGLVLQLRGKMVRREKSWFRKHYPGYGHSKEQGIEAFRKGREIAEKLLGVS